MLLQTVKSIYSRSKRVSSGFYFSILDKYAIHSNPEGFTVETLPAAAGNGIMEDNLEF
jgi:hypothetical protein